MYSCLLQIVINPGLVLIILIKIVSQPVIIVCQCVYFHIIDSIILMLTNLFKMLENTTPQLNVTS